MREEFTVYRSGMSRVSHLRAAVIAHVPVGVVATELSRKAREMLVAYLDAGGLAMADSGEFAAFNNRVKGRRDRRGRPLPTTVDFGRVLATYRALADDTRAPRNLAVVAPDEIGNQARTLALLKEHAASLTYLLDRGCELLVPLQRGRLTLAECFRRSAETLGTDRLTASLPANKLAVTEEEALEFAREVAPRRIHFLGLAKKSTLAARARALRLASPLTIISSDANRITALVGRGRPFTARVDRRVAAEGEAITHDLAYDGDPVLGLEEYTSFLNGVFCVPAFLNPAVARLLAELITPRREEQEEIVRAALSERELAYTPEEEAQFEEDYGSQHCPPRTELARWLFANCYGDEAVARCYEALFERARHKVRAKVTCEELAKELTRQSLSLQPPPLLSLVA